VEQGAGKLGKGESFSVKGTRGKVVGYEGDKILIDIGGVQVGRALRELKSKEIANLANRVLEPDAGETDLQLALFLICEGDADAARQHFDAAAQKETVVTPYRRLFAYLEKVRKEELAQAAARKEKEKGKEDVATPSTTGTRTKSQVLALIEKAGRTRPDWWNEVKMLDYPRTLDLKWPQPPRGTRNPQKYVGQYFWDTVNPNPHLWKPGAKFMHYIISINKGNDLAIRRASDTLAHVYTGLLEDYARGAYWFHTRPKDQRGALWFWLELARCYWKLGNKSMAIESLGQIKRERRNEWMVRLLADMGYDKKALEVSAEISKRGTPDIGYLAAGDVYRHAGKYGKAIECYEKILGMTAEDLGRRFQWMRSRAQISLWGTRQLEALDISKIRDGTYTGTNRDPERDVEVTVEVKVADGKITGCRVTRHTYRHFGSALTVTPSQIVERNGFMGVDLSTSNANLTERITYAVASALPKTRR